MRYADIRAQTGLYECGSDDAYNRLANLNKIQFFRVIVLFLLFEVEIAVLLMAMPILSLLDAESIVVITIFIFTIQIGAIMEVRSGAISWLKSSTTLLCLSPQNAGGAYLCYAAVCALCILLYLEFFSPLLSCRTM